MTVQSIYRTTTAVTLAVLGYSFLADLAVAGADENDTGPLMVIDAVGTPVGRLNGDNVVTTVSGERVQLGLRERTTGRVGLVWGGYLGNGWNMFFDSIDCTGSGYLPSYVTPRPFGTVPTAMIHRGGEDDLYIGHSLKPQSLPGPWHSYVKGDGTCMTEESSGPFDGWILDSPVNVDTLFALPFRIK